MTQLFRLCLRSPITSPNQMNLRVPHPWFIRVGSYARNARILLASSAPSVRFLCVLCVNSPLYFPTSLPIYFSCLQRQLPQPHRIAHHRRVEQQLMFALQLDHSPSAGSAKKLPSNSIRRILVTGWEGKYILRVPCCCVLDTGSSLYLETSGERRSSALFFPTTTFPSSQAFVTPNRVWYAIGNQQPLPQASCLCSAFTNRSPA